ncbi:hypothetical protein NW767_015273 [Fusarium falciforme]|nr:hypothetical protein NW767_015273 [Fusarium falciforme]
MVTLCRETLPLVATPSLAAATAFSTLEVWLPLPPRNPSSHTDFGDKGIRFGTAEIYAVVDHFPEVQDCIAVGQRRPGESDEQVLLFLKTGTSDFNQVRGQIQEAIREQLSPRHVPAHILHVNDIPCTSNGKVIEMVVKAIVCKSRVANIDSVANPECLAEYRKFADLPSSSGEAKL